jgi:Zn-dependent protease with chaperone function
MQPRRPWHFYRLISLSLLAALCTVTPLRAQIPSQDFDDEDQKSASTLSLSVTLSESGKANVAAYAFTRSPGDLKPALESAFHCALESKFANPSGSYFGSCALPASRVGLLHDYRITTKPLLDYEQQHSIDSLELQLTLPDTDVRETIPRAHATTFPGKTSVASVNERLAAVRFFSWPTNAAAVPESIEVHVGYEPTSIQRNAMLLLGALLAPIAFGLWLRRRALSAQTADKSSVWFSYLRYQSWLLNGSLVLWWAAEETAHLDGFTRFLLATYSLRFTLLPGVVSSLLTWIPPVLVWIICVVISHPVQEKLRGLQWTRKELVLQAVYSLSSALLPLLLGIKGIGAISRGSFRAGVIWIIAALVVKFIARAKLLKLLGMQPQALTTGDLRDSAFAMATRLGVKLQQIYVIPAGKGQMANAFARSGNTIAFTDYLLQRMTRREVNYIIGHELSHLRLKHLQKLSYAFLGSLFLGVFLFTTFRASLQISPFFRFGLFFAITTLVPYFWSRRFEFSADAGAVEATDDPEAAISALFKLAGLNMHPMHWSKWSEKWLTHPSTLRRAQAIARKAAIPFERLPEIARTAMQEDAHYVIPASAIAGNKILSTTKKTSNAVQALLAMLSAIILTPTAFALFVKFTHFSPPVQRLIYLGGFAAAVAAYLAVCNFFPVRKVRGLIPQLKAKVQAEGVQADAWNAVTVGLAPGPVPRTYEGHAQWDLGFLFLCADRICYWGEETRFSLRRDQITAIKLGSGTPNLFPSKRVYIAWRDVEGSTCGVFSLGCVAPETSLALRRRTKNLFTQLLLWRTTSSPAGRLPAPLDSLSAPKFGSVTGISPATIGKRETVLKQMYLFGLLAAAAAVVAGLPFHLLSALTQIPSVRGTQPDGIGSGWYVVAVALAVILLQYIPYFLYKDVPVLQASLGTLAAQRPSSNGETKPQVGEPESVNTLK